MAVDTKNVSGCRKLSFRNAQAMLAEVDRLVALERAGKLRALGNWTLGQVLGHIAEWIRFAFDGYPETLRPPWFIRFAARLMKRKLLATTLRPGLRLNVPGGTLGTEVLPLDEGLRRFRANWNRLLREAPTHPSPIFGVMTHDEWQTLNLRHTELHLGFFVEGV